MSRKKTDRWKNRQPLEKLWWKPQNPISDEIIKECQKERKLLSNLQNKSRWLVFPLFSFCKKIQVVHDAIDGVLSEGYIEAIDTYDPDKGTKFSTHIHRVMKSLAIKELRRYLSKFKRWPETLETTVHSVGLVPGNHGLPVNETGLVVRTRCYAIESIRIHGICLGYIETKWDEHNEKQFFANAPNPLRWYLDDIANISDKEFSTIERRHLPALYRKMTNDRLRQSLSELDQNVFLLVNEGHQKNTIMLMLGVKRNFLQTRLIAIARRLHLLNKGTVRGILEQRRKGKILHLLMKRFRRNSSDSDLQEL